MNRFIKSIIDYIGAIIALIIFLPVMIWTAWRIKREDGGNVLFIQDRVGCKKRCFKICKFRSIPGKTLRRTINNLPQLFNVLKGEMSLVGPRALIQSDSDFAYGDYDAARKIYTVKPGMTGFWQVSGWHYTDANIRREMNLYYIRNWSLWLDIVILMRTAYVVISRK